MSSDWKVLKYLLTGRWKEIQFKVPEENLTPTDIKKGISSNWIWFLLLIAAFLCGALIASQYYQSVCNELIYEIVQGNTFNFSYNGTIQTITYTR